MENKDMISWPISSFIYVPLNVNSISTQNPVCSLENLILTSGTAQNIKDQCLKKGDPIVFDFYGIMLPEARAFQIFDNIDVQRPIVFININQLTESRLRDDGVPLNDDIQYKNSLYESSFGIGSLCTEELLDEINAINGRFFHSYVISKSDALSEYRKILPSTPVYATKFYDVKKLCIQEISLQILATGLATAILQEGIEFDFVVSSSLTGSFIAVPVSILLKKPWHCWTNLGPSYSPKRQMEWNVDKSKRCLLVADVVCMGTEARTTQSFIAALGSQLVACAAIATYLPPNSLPSISLINREDLEEMGYVLSIPKLEVEHVTK